MILILILMHRGRLRAYKFIFKHRLFEKPPRVAFLVTLKHATLIQIPLQMLHQLTVCTPC